MPSNAGVKNFCKPDIGSKCTYYRQTNGGVEPIDPDGPVCEFRTKNVGVCKEFFVGMCRCALALKKAKENG